MFIFMYMPKTGSFFFQKKSTKSNLSSSMVTSQQSGRNWEPHGKAWKAAVLFY
jgi:hypothetical protein